MKIRHYGLFSSAGRAPLDIARALLTPTLDFDPPPIAAAPQAGTPLAVAIDVDRCPVCHLGHLHVIAILARPRAPP